MADLVGIRETTKNYLDNHLSKSFKVTPVVGNLINPGEQFKVELTLSNEPDPQGDVLVVDPVPVEPFVIEITTSAPSKVLLIVPKAPPSQVVPKYTVRKGLSATSEVLTEGQEVEKMYIHRNLPLLPEENWTLTFKGLAKATGTVDLKAVFSGTPVIVARSSVSSSELISISE
jgi:hypothetical protein